MPVAMLLDYLAVRLNGPAAQGVHLCINLELTDPDEQRVLELRRSVLHHHADRRRDDAQATLRASSADFKAMLAGATTLAAEVDAGRITIDGDATVFDRLVGLLDDFRTWFPIVEP